MRKIIFIIITVLLAVALGYIVIYGEKLGKFEILSYKQIDSESDSVNGLINKYNDKNTKDLEAKEKQLTTQIEEYNKQKKDYEDILVKKQTDLANIDTANCYEIDFLWTRVGNYATEYGLDLEFNVTKNVADQNKSEYILTDLNFSIRGSYEYIAKFIDAIETDERLNFEIRDFNMAKKTVTENKDGKEVKTEFLQATFKVYSIAINRSTLTQLTPEQQNALMNNTNQTNTNTTNKPNVSDTTNVADTTNTNAGF